MSVVERLIVDSRSANASITITTRNADAAAKSMDALKRSAASATATASAAATSAAASMDTLTRASGSAAASGGRAADMIAEMRARIGALSEEVRTDSPIAKMDTQAVAATTSFGGWSASIKAASVALTAVTAGVALGAAMLNRMASSILSATSGAEELSGTMLAARSSALAWQDATASANETIAPFKSAILDLASGALSALDKSVRRSAATLAFFRGELGVGLRAILGFEPDESQAERWQAHWKRVTGEGILDGWQDRVDWSGMLSRHAASEAPDLDEQKRAAAQLVRERERAAEEARRAEEAALEEWRRGVERREAERRRMLEESYAWRRAAEEAFQRFMEQSAERNAQAQAASLQSLNQQRQADHAERVALQWQYVDVMSGSLDQILRASQQFAGRSKAAQQALGVAQVAIATAVAIAKSFQEYGPTPLGFAAAGGMAVMGAGQIAAVLSASPGGASSLSGVQAGPVVPDAVFAPAGDSGQASTGGGSTRSRDTMTVRTLPGDLIQLGELRRALDSVGRTLLVERA